MSRPSGKLRRRKQQLLHSTLSEYQQSKEFKPIIDKRIDEANYNFRGVYFPDGLNLFGKKFETRADFRNTTFKKFADFSYARFIEQADFTSAIFNEDIYFHSASFRKHSIFVSSIFSKKAHFDKVDFLDKVYFVSARFNQDTFFNNTTFQQVADFRYVVFEEKSQTFFVGTIFQDKTYFTESIISGSLTFQGGKRIDYVNDEKVEKYNTVFIGNKVFLDFQNIKVKNPEFLSFHTVRLQPSWFINTDCRKFIFTACHWEKEDGKDIDVKSELKALENNNISNSNKLLTKTSWQLADNHEESKSFPKASLFRQMANESKRLEDYRGWKFWSLHWWYWSTSYYGESWQRALAILIGIWFTFAIVYTQFDFNICQPTQPCVVRKLFIGEAMKQSFGTMFLQKSEFRKPMETAETFILFENILAPLQVALLALAIRRKFMR